MASAKISSLSLALGLLSLAGCSQSTSSSDGGAPSPKESGSTRAPGSDPRVGLGAGLMDAEEAAWNLRVLSKTPPSEHFLGMTNSDLAFSGSYAIQGNYNGYQVWDITDPRKPSLKTAYVCPASQSDVSVYKNLLFVSGENLAGRIDCGTQGVEDTVSTDRLRGIRIFDISDIGNPRNVGNVQTCRGSHTHTVLVDPKDRENVYVYISGSAQRSQLGAVPDRSHQGAAGPSRAGRGGQLAPDLPRPGETPGTRRRAGGHRRQKEGRGRGQGRGPVHGGDGG
jgi:hypothetical protein